MGREVKRVPLDFDYPLGKVWYGYRIVMQVGVQGQQSLQIAVLNFPDTMASLPQSASIMDISSSTNWS